jgi:putative heme iron utilization protein
LVDPRCSLTVAEKDFKGNADARVNLMGTASKLGKEDIDGAKELYRKKHPDAFWVDFGDFTWFKIDVEKIHYVGGFGKIGGVPIKEYRDAKPDEISAFGGHIASHMNDDHMESTIAMIESAVPGIAATEAIITSVDSLGMFVKVTRKSKDQVQQFKMRLPFPRPAKDRKDVKNVIVEMTQATAPASE